MDSLRGVSCDCSSFWRLTLRITPNAMTVKSTDEPPREMTKADMQREQIIRAPVSYTHLTLPTILRV